MILEANSSRDPLGAFPRIFRLKGGNMEVASVNGKRYLRATSTGAFSIPLPEVLPHRFTLEFDLAGSGGQVSGHSVFERWRSLLCNDSTDR